MTFIRTTSGISNQHLFHNVDIIVFVEGGDKCFTKEQIDYGMASKHSIDVLFWEKIFEKFNTPKEIKFKAVGSKTTITKIAEDIIDNDLTTVYAAMDKEFDEPLGNLIVHKNVLYSFGYSWENDAWNCSLITEILKDLTASTIKKDLIDKHWLDFVRKIKIAVYADGYRFSKGSSFFPRPGYMRFVECRITHKTHIKVNEINSLISNYSLKKSVLYSFGSRKSIESIKHCYGHLLGDFCWHLIQYVLRNKFKLSSINKELIRRMVINKFIKHMSIDISNYYQKQFS